MLITEPYREQQKQLHATTNYGVASIGHAPIVANLINKYNVREVLDYGAGRLNLMKTISDQRLVKHEFKYIPYEPANPLYSDSPEPAEMVACLDVLEHIEPELLDNVLIDLARVTKRVGVFTVDCQLAVKTLADGRNAHLIVEPMEWWLPRIMKYFELHLLMRTAHGFIVVVRPHDGTK